jgi:hypothetical protein
LKRGICKQVHADVRWMGQIQTNEEILHPREPLRKERSVNDDHDKDDDDDSDGEIEMLDIE